NDIRGSNDAGVTWPGRICCEGFYLRVARITPNDSTTNVTGVSCSGCRNFLANAQLTRSGWPDAPGCPANPKHIPGNPFPLSGNSYIQNTVDSSATPSVNTFMLTRDVGGSWSPAFTVSLDLSGIPAVAGAPASPSIYQGVRRPGATSDGQAL